MRTRYLTEAKKKLEQALESETPLTAEQWVDVAKNVLSDVRLTMVFARNTTPKGFLFSTSMSEEQVLETEEYKRISGLESGEGCTMEINQDLYRYIRWIIKRDNNSARFRTIKLTDTMLSISRIA